MPDQKPTLEYAEPDPFNEAERREAIARWVQFALLFGTVLIGAAAGVVLYLWP